MGTIVSRLNIFKACRDPQTEAPKEEKKEEPKRPKYKGAKSSRKKKAAKPPSEVSSSDVLLDDDIKSFTQIGFRNDDGYFSHEELEYYRKLYADEKVEQKPLTNIK